MKFCDMRCKYAKFAGGKNDGAGCRTFVAVFCDKKKRTVAKNMPCEEKELNSAS
jgi:hypothetical protein